MHHQKSYFDIPVASDKILLNFPHPGKLGESHETWRNHSLDVIRYLYLDARYEKRRVDGQIRDAAILTASGVSLDEKHQILGLSVSLGEQDRSEADAPGQPIEEQGQGGYNEYLFAPRVQTPSAYCVLYNNVDFVGLNSVYCL